MCDTGLPQPNRPLRYCKGEHRRKHRGTHERATMVLQKGDFWVGKCPRHFCESRATMLLQRAIPEYRRTTGSAPYRLWAYYDGAIYAASSTDGGLTWHGFPNGPPMAPPPRSILRELWRRAQALGEEGKLIAWLCRQWKTKR
jgi:hypothetical protein